MRALMSYYAKIAAEDEQVHTHTHTQILIHMHTHTHMHTPTPTQPLTLEEVKERRKQLAKMRALMSYYEKKRQRINKIKSKNYHRKLKKEKDSKKMVCVCVGSLRYVCVRAQLLHTTAPLLLSSGPCVRVL